MLPMHEHFVDVAQRTIPRLLLSQSSMTYQILLGVEEIGHGRA